MQWYGVFGAFGDGPPYTRPDKTPAFARALDLLKRNCTPAQLEHERTHGYILAIGNVTGGVYRLNPKVTSFIECRALNGTITTYCLVSTVNVPWPDVMLARKLLIECDEDEFRRRANMIRGDHAAVQNWYLQRWANLHLPPQDDVPRREGRGVTHVELNQYRNINSDAVQYECVTRVELSAVMLSQAIDHEFIRERVIERFLREIDYQLRSALFIPAEIMRSRD